MKVAFIGQKGIAQGERGGGIEKHVYEVAARLASRNHRVFVYARKAYHPKMPKRIDGVQMVYKPTLYTKNLEAIIHTFISTLHAIGQKYDIIHYHGVGPSTLAWIPRLFARKTRVITTFHSQDRFHQKWSPFAKLYLFFGEWAAVYFPHACIAVSHVIQVYVRKVMRKEIVYIPNGAEAQSIRTKQELTQFNIESNNYILNVGRIVPQKGLQYLIPAYKKAKLTKDLVIVGAPSFSDQYFKELKALAEDDPRIHFLGYQSGDALKQLFAHAYLYVQPSESEGLSVAVLEAMSFGTAVLVSNIPENIEAMQNKGFTFKNTNINDLKKQLIYLDKHTKEVTKSAKDGQDIVKQRFNWDRIADHIESLYISTRH